MIDQEIPTNQFHPYQPVNATPHSESTAPGWKSILNKIGIDDQALNKVGGSLKNVNVQQGLGKARDYARANPGKVLGGLAALVIGAGLMRNRGMRARRG